MKDLKVTWAELEDASGINFRAYSSGNEVLVDTIFAYQDVDPDSIFDAAQRMIDLCKQ